MPYGDFLFSTGVKYSLAFRGGLSIAIAASPVSDPNPFPRGRGEPIHPSGSLSHRERARVRAFGVLAEKLCQSIRIPTLTGISILLFVSEYLKSGRV
ncbi:MAG: hypothetical protein EBV05_05755 [Cyanobacteria bacterium WB6_1B_304]|jgi:hypothetical protein|nr:hypothetical protein [Cyanobacteria bacterium WB6_1B_304]